MGRKNKRKQSAYYRKLRISPARLKRKAEPCGGSVGNRVATADEFSTANAFSTADGSTAVDGSTIVDGHIAGGKHTAEREHRTMIGKGLASNRRIPQRGEIWFAKFGNHPGTSVQAGCRPALVVSNDVANRYSATVTVIPMTTRMKKEYLPTHVVVRASNVNAMAGQQLRSSMLLAEQVTTIGKDALVGCVGRIKEDKLKEAETALLVQMNISSPDIGLGDGSEKNLNRKEMAFNGS